MNTPSMLKRTEPRLHTIFTSKGLTLLEVLIAITMSAIILLGLYSAITTSLSTDKALHNRMIGVREYVKLAELFQRDIRSMISTPLLRKTIYGSELLFSTTHSLMYSSTRPVKVRYFIERIDGVNYLIREEMDEKGDHSISIRLLDEVEDLKFLGDSKQGWIEKILPQRSLKMVYSYKGKEWEIISGRLI